jgi:hypothetical protein
MRVSIIYKAAGDLGAVQILLGTPKSKAPSAAWRWISKKLLAESTEV